MKTKTTLLLLISFIFLAGNIMVKAQPTEVWNQTPAWNADYHYRGIAYNENNHHLYVSGAPRDGAGNSADPAQNLIQVLDASTGDVLKTLNLEPLTGNGYGIKDVEVDEAGGIFATMTTTNQWHPIRIYYWENEDTEPVILWQDASGIAIPHGPGFSVTGDFANGNSLIILPHYTLNTVYYFESSNGVLGDVQTLTLTGVTGGKNVAIRALGDRIVDGFWYDNNLLADPSIIDGTGNIIDALDNANFLTTTDIAGIKHYTAGANEYLTVGTKGDIVIVDVTGATDLSNVTIDDTVRVILGTDPSPEWGTPYGYGQEEAVLANPDGSYAIFSLSGDRYIKAIATDGAPTAIDLKLTGSPVAGEIKTAEYTYIDMYGDLEATSEIKWYIADDAIGTNIAEITANAGNFSYTLDAADAGKYISFTILPVAATGTVSNPLHLATSVPFGPVLATETAPVAANTAIAGANEVFEVLTASYDFSDAGSDLEGDSDYRWYRTDDDAGTNAVEIASGSLTYTIQPDDAGKYVMFVVTPASATGWPLVGDADTAYTSTTILFLPAPPVASDVAISGRYAVEAILTGSYTYSDLNDDAEEGSILNWYSVDTTTAGLYGGDTSLVATDTNMYEVVVGDQSRQIWFEVTPVSVPTVGVDTGATVMVSTDTIAQKPDEYAPIAKDVTLLGSPEVDAILSSSYTYMDTIVNDPEGESIYKWYTADDATGTNAILIADATTQNLLITEAQLGKHIIFEVTPVAVSGGILVGTPVQDISSDAVIASTMSDQGLELVWAGTDLLGAVPDYFDASVKCIGVSNGDHFYVASRENTATISIVNKVDGMKVGELDNTGIDATGTLVGAYAINDIEVSDDGQILAAPIVTGSSFWIWKWENEAAQPTKYVEADLAALGLEGKRFGDKISVTGDLTGEAIIIAPVTSASQTYTDILRWRVTGGIPGVAEHIELQGISWGTGNNAELTAYTSGSDSKMLLESRSNARYIFDAGGNNLTQYGLPEGTIKVKQTLGSDVFNYKNNFYAAYITRYDRGSATRGARILIQDLTTHAFVDSSDYFTASHVTTDYYGDLEVLVDGDFYYVYGFQINKGVGVWRGTAYPPEFVSGITSWSGDTLSTEFSKNLGSDSVHITMPNWTINVGGASAEIDTLYGEGTYLTFVLTTPITNGQVVTLEYDGEGGLLSLEGLNLSAFGPINIENIAGAEVPVATDVAVTGDPYPTSVLTGTYTFTDPDGDLEGTSLYQWYEATDDTGANELKLLGENSVTYTVAADMTGKYLAFEVTPVSATGGADYLEGAPVKSAYILVNAVGIEDNLFAGLVVYPNPVVSILTIDNCDDVQKVSIMNVTGKVIQTMETNFESRITINMEAYGKGIYFLKLNADDGSSKVVRIIKVQ